MSITTDVIIFGVGIVGAATAYGPGKNGYKTYIDNPPKRFIPLAIEQIGHNRLILYVEVQHAVTAGA